MKNSMKIFGVRVILFVLTFVALVFLPLYLTGEFGPKLKIKGLKVGQAVAVYVDDTLHHFEIIK